MSKTETEKLELQVHEVNALIQRLPDDKRKRVEDMTKALMAVIDLDLPVAGYSLALLSSTFTLNMMAAKALEEREAQGDR